MSLTSHQALPRRVFVSYAHEDEELRRELENHLKVLERQGYIDLWTDRRIQPGTDWKQELDQRLLSADLILMLISANFFASDYCWGKELRIALDRHRDVEDLALVVPILVRHVDFEGSAIATIQGLPPDARPVDSWPNRDEAWTTVAKAIRELVTRAPPTVRRRPQALMTAPSDHRRLPAEAGYRRLAKWMAARIDRIDDNERWSDRRYAELDSEVEGGGRNGWLGRVMRSAEPLRGLRREPISVALRDASEPLVLLEGEPGSGKSVCLRHHARSLAQQAIDGTGQGRQIPIYLDLRRLHPPPEGPVDAAHIRDHVLRELRSVNDPPLLAFLEQGFEEGMQRGSWLFLLDGFDEIPAVLGATELDETVSAYAHAIKDFVFAMSECRAIVASRPYRGPTRMGWPRIKLLSASPDRRRSLLRAHLGDASHDDLILGWLVERQNVLGTLQDNPFFLSLLCAFARRTGALPDHVHQVFAELVRDRFERDAHRVAVAYGLDLETLREVGEAIGYCMAAREDLGLKPEVDRLVEAVAAAPLGTAEDVRGVVDALVELRLGSIEADAEGGRAFAFSHRRFQENFSTAAVLENPGLVSREQLLLNARWREAAVVLLQTETGERFAALTEKAEEFIRAQLELLADIKGDLAPFPWPPGLLHVLGVLQSGLAGRLHDVPQSLRQAVEEVVRLALKSESSLDRKWALEVAGPAPQAALSEWIREAFASESGLLGDVAFRQAANLRALPDTLTTAIRWWLLDKRARKELAADLPTIRAQLLRSPVGEAFLPALRLLRVSEHVGRLYKLLVALTLLTYCSSAYHGVVGVPAFLVGLLGLLVMEMGNSPEDMSLFGHYDRHRGRRHSFMAVINYLGGLFGSLGLAMLAGDFLAQGLRVLSAGAVFELESGASDLWLAFFLASALAAVWDIGAIRGAESGKGVLARWWWLLPLRGIATIVRGYGWLLMAIVLMIPVVIRRLPQLVLILMLAPFSLPLVVFGLPAIFWLDARALRELEDTVRDNPRLSIDHLLAWLARLKTPWAVKRFLARVQQDNLLIPEPRATEVLAGLERLRVRDRKRLRRRFRSLDFAVWQSLKSFRLVLPQGSSWRPKPPVEGVDPLADWHRHYTSYGEDRLGGWNQQIGDFLVLLQEQVRGRTEPLLDHRRLDGSRR